MDTPKQIGRYEVIREIGRGAMGLVYLAHDPRIDRPVAIKTIHALDVLPRAEADDIRRRFTREAQAAGRLQHPGIVTIFDVGEHEGTYFIAMEYIEGDTLEPYTRKEKLLPTEATLGLIVQACEALDYAHQQNIIHRDIKPANLMLVKGSRLKITDFGLAKNPQTNLTHDGVLIGTPNYMSPEQIMGKALDGRSDLFSLAAVLYEMLTGERPFHGDSVTTIIYRILHEQPKEARSINAKVPSAISQVLMRALAKNPAHRFQTGIELARALQGQVAAVAAAGADAVPAAIEPREDRHETSAGTPAAPARTLSPKAKPAREAAAAGPGRAARAEAPARREAIHSRIRAAFILAGAAAAVLLVPGSATIDDRWGRVDPAGNPPFYRTAGIVTLAGGPPGAGPGAPKPVAPPAPVVALPGDADTVAVTWRTTPPGGRIYLDDVEIPSGVARVRKDDAASHTVVAENECFIEKVGWKIGRAGMKGEDETHTIALKTPKVENTRVSSTPSGARILLDGRETDLTAPAELPVSICGAHTVTARLDGYTDAVRKIDSPVGSVTLALSRIPEGLVKIASSYPLEIFEKGKRVGRAGESLKLTAGKHTLILRNEALFVERSLDVAVEPEKTVSPEPGLPGVGTLTVLASPSNCKIFVNGREIGDSPINDQQLAAGTYVIRAVYQPTGEAKEQTVTIAARSGTRVPFRFNK